MLDFTKIIMHVNQRTLYLSMKRVKKKIHKTGENICKLYLIMIKSKIHKHVYNSTTHTHKIQLIKTVKGCE